MLPIARSELVQLVRNRPRARHVAAHARGRERVLHRLSRRLRPHRQPRLRRCRARHDDRGVQPLRDDRDHPGLAASEPLPQAAALDRGGGRGDPVRPRAPGQRDRRRPGDRDPRGVRRGRWRAARRAPPRGRGPRDVRDAARPRCRDRRDHDLARARPGHDAAPEPRHGGGLELGGHHRDGEPAAAQAAPARGRGDRARRGRLERRRRALRLAPPARSHARVGRRGRRARGPYVPLGPRR